MHTFAILKKNDGTFLAVAPVLSRDGQYLAPVTGFGATPAEAVAHAKSVLRYRGGESAAFYGTLRG